MPQLEASLSPLGDAAAIRIAGELTAIAEASPETPWEALEMFAPRLFKPPRATSLTTSPKTVAIDLVYHWSEYGMHRNVEWSMYDASIRVDMRTLADGDDEDAQYVYGRIVSSIADLHEAVLAIPDFEDYSYWSKGDEEPEWEARNRVWNRVNEKSLFGWLYRPHRITMMNGLREGED